MEAQTRVSHTSTNQVAPTETTSMNRFPIGASVIYNFHGKCTVAAIESRVINEQTVEFYKLEVQKSVLSRSTRLDPAIWVPIATAQEHGLRLPVDETEVDTILKTISSREYYFQLQESWPVVQSKLDAVIKSEGCIGLAKVVSYLHVLKRKQIVPTTEANRMSDLTMRLLLRELSEALKLPIRSVEAEIAKALRQKLIPDT